MKIKLNYNKAKTVAEKGFTYILKEQDGVYYLIIPSTIGVGSDIIRKMTEEERDLYDEKGEEALEKLIEEMNANPHDFDVRSWR